MTHGTGAPGQAVAGRPAGDGPGAAARRRGGQAQRRLISAATAEIAERGWLGATTRRVAARAGLTPALVHYHFGSVENLRRAAATAAGEEMMEGPLGQLLATGDLPAGLASALRAIGDLDPGDPRMRVLLESSLRATHDRELGQVVAGMLTSLRTVLTGRIEEAVASGRMRPCEPAATAALIAALLDGIGIHKYLDPGLDLASAAGVLQALLTQNEPGAPQ